MRVRDTVRAGHHPLTHCTPWLIEETPDGVDYAHMACGLRVRKTTVRAIPGEMITCVRCLVAAMGIDAQG